MRSSGAPFLINIYPFLTRVQNRSAVPSDYCLFTADANHWVQDGNYTYKNIFDAMIDAEQFRAGVTTLPPSTCWPGQSCDFAPTTMGAAIGTNRGAAPSSGAEEGPEHSVGALPYPGAPEAFGAGWMKRLRATG